jgi:DNA-binding transcriptional MerR regulator
MALEDELLTDKDVSERAKVSPNTVKYWRQIGLLPFVKVGKHPRIWLSDFNRVFQKPDKIAVLGRTLKEFSDGSSK